MNELLELELWRIIGQGNDKSGGGYSGGGRGPNRDDFSPMPLCLIKDGEGNEIGKVEDMPVRHAPQEIGVVRVDDAGALSPSCQSVGQDGMIVEVCHDDLQIEGQAEFHCELEVHQLDDLKEEPPRFSRQEGSDRGPKGNWRNGCLISAVGPEDDAAPFLFFEVGTAVHARVVLSVLNTGGGHGRAAKFSVSTTVFRHGRVAHPCCFDRLAYSHVARPWQLIASRVGEKVFSVFSQSCCTVVSPPVG
ncbi:hypothetical protein GOBAR_AA18436 [Gossypium barbadense]|uniref:Uncharacterized protein n=1 Tax=Gossypium barbadense TaxID=3634 RepID=A0A2P5XFX7_GOSBA|nr:hypothetical protein GOBAR_AA18436 [Gossypium barbadense]